MANYIKFHRIPWSIGLEVEKTRVMPLILKDSLLPAEVRHLFTTIQNHQIAAEIHILKGEGKTVDTCDTLARILLPGINRAARGKSRLEVILGADINGFLALSVKDVFSGNEVFAILSDLSNREAATRFITAKSLGRQKVKVMNLIGCLTALELDLKDCLQQNLQREINGVLRDARYAITADSAGNLQSSQLFLECLVNELYTIKNR